MGSGLRRTALGVALAALALAGLPLAAQAGCGCTKPAPELAQVRPAATWAGMEVTLFHPAIAPGASYEVTFVSGVDGTSVSVPSTATIRRDVADGAFVPLLAAALPALPLGPAAIHVNDALGQPVLFADDSQLTVAPEPIALPTDPAEHHFADYRAAVTRDGVVLVSLDFSNVQHARVFRAQAMGYPMRFQREDVSFWNVQGFLMQQLDESIPGLFSLKAMSNADSNVLHYSRHEFNTYLLQHAERKVHAVAADDANWHGDGSAHIDHNHQIVNIAASLPGGGLPEAGATPPFELVIDTYSLFHHGLFAEDRVKLGRGAQTDSFDSREGVGVYGSQGDVLSNGSIQLVGHSLIDGSATAPSVIVSKNASVTGEIVQNDPSTLFLGVNVPSGLEHLGSLKLDDGNEFTLQPGSYYASEIDVSDEASLVIDNREGPVTIYVDGPVRIDREARVFTRAQDPERFALYVHGRQQITLADTGAMYGVIYAPRSYLELGDQAEFHGALVAGEIWLDDDAHVHYDVALRGRTSSDEAEAHSDGAGSVTAMSAFVAMDEPEATAAPEPIESGSDIDVSLARYKGRRGIVRVLATSSSDDTVPLRITIEGLVEDAPMKWSERHGRWRYRAHSDGMNLDGARVTIRAEDGGSSEVELD